VYFVGLCCIIISVRGANNIKIITKYMNYLLVEGDQKDDVHLMITIYMSGAQRLFDHPVAFKYTAS
jgi:hypothetical protein